MTDQHEPGTLRSELVKAVYRSWVLNELLEHEVAEPVGRGMGSGLKTLPGGTRAPWNSLAAELVMDLHSMARELESLLNSKVVGQWPVRGYSSRNTWLALYHLTDLAEAVVDQDVRIVLLDIRSWVGRAEVALGQAEPIRRLPRDFGQGEPVCPWCGYMTLRCHVVKGTVFCVNPVCRDTDGNRAYAALGVSEFGELVLTWQDGTHRVPEPYRKDAA